jgi:AraC-like DNA-binding protein
MSFQAPPPAPKQDTPLSWKTVQSRFFECMAPGAMTALFHCLEGVAFFLKNVEGHILGFSHQPGPRLDYGEENTLLGKTDYDLYPKAVADRIRKDDARVMESRQPLLNIVELLINPTRHAIGWYVTNKFPVLSAQGEVLGVMGTIQPFEGRRRLLFSGTRLEGVIETIVQRPHAEHRIHELARSAGMSARSLGRHFQRILGMSPQQFCMMCRMQVACELLVGSQHSIAEIAQKIGFCDQSSLSYHFRRNLGTSPLVYRHQFQKASSASPRCSSSS